MFDQFELKNVAGLNHTSKVIFDTLSKRLRFRRQTNLTNFHNHLINTGEKIIEDEFLDTFKGLQILGVGSLIFGRNGKPNRFKWNYNLKDVAKAAKSDAKMEVKEMFPAGKPQVTFKRGPGRPRIHPKKVKAARIFKSSPEAMKTHVEPSVISITLQIGGNSRPEDIAALLDLAKQLK